VDGPGNTSCPGAVLHHMVFVTHEFEPSRFPPPDPEPSAVEVAAAVWG